MVNKMKKDNINRFYVGELNTSLNIEFIEKQ